MIIWECGDLIFMELEEWSNLLETLITFN